MSSRGCCWLISPNSSLFAFVVAGGVSVPVWRRLSDRKTVYSCCPEVHHQTSSHRFSPKMFLISTCDFYFQTFSTLCQWLHVKCSCVFPGRLRYIEVLSSDLQKNALAALIRLGAVQKIKGYVGFTHLRVPCWFDRLSGYPTLTPMPFVCGKYWAHLYNVIKSQLKHSKKTKTFMVRIKWKPQSFLVLLFSFHPKIYYLSYLSSSLADGLDFICFSVDIIPLISTSSSQCLCNTDF